MANVPTLFSRGRAVDRADRVIAGTGVIMGVLLLEGQEADATLADRITLADVLAVTANKEPSWTNGTAYQRKSWAGATCVVNQQPANDRTDLQLTSNPTWLTPGAPASSGVTPQRVGKLGLCYAATVGAATTGIWPLIWLDWSVTAEGNDIIDQLDPAGFYRT